MKNQKAVLLGMMVATAAAAAAAADDSTSQQMRWGDAPSVKPRCPPGYHLSPPTPGQGEVCLPCPPGQFRDSWSRHRRCRAHEKRFKSGEARARNGSRFRDVIRICAEGERVYYKYDSRDPLAYDCRPCPAGMTSLPVRNGHDAGDTGCCHGDQTATRDEGGRLLCGGMTPPQAQGGESSSRTATAPPPSPPPGDVERRGEEGAPSRLSAPVWTVVGTVLGIPLGILGTLVSWRLHGSCKKRSAWRRTSAARSKKPVLRMEYTPAADVDTGGTLSKK